MFVQDVIIRGTTAVHEFQISYNMDEIKSLYIAYGQNRKVIIKRDKTSAQLSDRKITTQLSQEDTRLFVPDKMVTIEIKLALADGQVVSNAEQPVCLRVVDSLIEEELS